MASDGDCGQYDRSWAQGTCRGQRTCAGAGSAARGWTQVAGGERRRSAPGRWWPSERGDPESGLRWTCKRVRRLATELCARGHQVSHTVVAELLKTLGFSLQANSKTREGASHPDRDAQFRYIDRQAKAALRAHEPVISVDTKKKELVGAFKNGGQEWRPKGDPEEVRV